MDLDIGGTTVPKGSYTLYSLPGMNSWKLIVNKQTGQWGTEYNQSQDLARISHRVELAELALRQIEQPEIDRTARHIALAAGDAAGRIANHSECVRDAANLA